MPRLTLVAAVLFSAVFAMRSPRFQDPFATWERARVRAHLDSAERELRGERVADLTASQRAARARALDRLHEYWVRGVFPENTDFPGQFTPSFIDRNRARCAMAYLIEQSGARALVAQVAATDNNARIPALKADPALVAWLHENGLTLADAARIQPTYGGGCLACVDCCVEFTHRPSASTGYKTATGVSVGADMVAVALSAAPSRLSRAFTGVLGIAAGMVGIVIGAPNFDESGSRRTLGFVDAGVGAVSVVLGVHRLAQKPSTISRVSFAPWLSSNRARGLSARIAF